jgi:hypothetical protein
MAFRSSPFTAETACDVLQRVLRPDSALLSLWRVHNSSTLEPSMFDLDRIEVEVLISFP